MPRHLEVDGVAGLAETQPIRRDLPLHQLVHVVVGAIRLVRRIGPLVRKCD